MFIFFSGQILMCDEESDIIFPERLRELTNAKHSRCKAFTVVRSFIGTVKKVGYPTQSEVNLTKKHLDGPNDIRNSYKHTSINSFLSKWNNKIYRMTWIAYTRRSCGN